MSFRKAGDPSPPSSPVPADEVECENDESTILSDFYAPDEIRTLMNQITQQCFKKTGLDEMMKGLPVSQQLIIAERIQNAKEELLEKMLE